MEDRRNGGEREGRADLYDCNDEGGAPQGSPHAVSKPNNLHRNIN